MAQVIFSGRKQYSGKLTVGPLNCAFLKGSGIAERGGTNNCAHGKKAIDSEIDIDGVAGVWARP